MENGVLMVGVSYNTSQAPDGSLEAFPIAALAEQGVSDGRVLLRDIKAPEDWQPPVCFPFQEVNGTVAGGRPVRMGYLGMNNGSNVLHIWLAPSIHNANSWEADARMWDEFVSNSKILPHSSMAEFSKLWMDQLSLRYDIIERDGIINLISKSSEEK